MRRLAKGCFVLFFAGLFSFCFCERVSSQVTPPGITLPQVTPPDVEKLGNVGLDYVDLFLIVKRGPVVYVFFLVQGHPVLIQVVRAG